MDYSDDYSSPYFASGGIHPYFWNRGIATRDYDIGRPSRKDQERVIVWQCQYCSTLAPADDVGNCRSCGAPRVSESLKAIWAVRSK
jgi:hypothetical protein